MYSQAEMPLYKHKDFLDLSVNQFVIQSNPISLGSNNAWRLKKQTLMLLVAKLVRYFSC